MENKGLLRLLKSGLAKTRKLLLTNVDDLVLGAKELDEHLFEELEEILISADLGPAFTYEMIEKIKEHANRKQLKNDEVVRHVLRESMQEILRANEDPMKIPAIPPLVLLVVGVNGTGKTTTVGKLGFYYKNAGKRVMFVAADTFRAAAIEQLEIWSRRANADLIRQNANADPSSVVFDALRAVRTRPIDVMIVDTAGRLHTKVNLMEELKKMKRIMAREMPGTPHQVLLVLDATTGQNAISQARMFHGEIGVTGLVLTKLDGTAKGGMVIRIAKELRIPIQFVGVGEGVNDLRPFDSNAFIAALFDQNEQP